MKIKFGSPSRSLLLIALLAFSSVAARAAVLTWDGSVNGFWTNAANWTPGFRPTNGDSLLFPVAPAQLLMTNVATSGTATNFRSLTFTGEDYFLYGPTLSLTNGLTNTPPINGVNTIAARLTLRASQTWLAGSKTVLVVSSNVGFTNLTFTIDNAGVIQFDGAIAGGSSSTINKTNVGTMEINGSAIMTQLNVQDGTLRLDGSYSGGMAISNGATLSGTGSASAFTCAGTLSPGGSSPGVFTTTGSPFFSSGSTLSLNLNGLVPGVDYDQFVVQGLTTFTGCSLQIIPGFNPQLGDSFVIVTNVGAGAINSTFSGLAEGATQTVNNVQFRVSYVGGNGNDVTLTVVGFTASATTRLWDGGGVGNGWMNATNWSNNVAPAGGQNLIFPAGAPQLSASNNFPAGTTFNAISLLAGGYDLHGNALRLLGGIDAAQPSGTPVTVRPSITFSGAQTVRVDNVSSVLNLGAAGTAPSLAGLLTLEGPGQVNFNGNLGGSGGLDVRGDAILRGTNSDYSGVTRVYDGGRLSIVTPRALGTNTAGHDTLVESNGVLEIFVAMTNAEPLRLAGQLSLPNGGTWLGPITLLGTNIDFAPSTDTFLAAPITGTNVKATLSQAGPLTLAANNSVSGSFTAGGDLIVQGLSRFDVLVGLSGSLSGTGEVAKLTANGPVHPGVNGAGTLTCSNFSNVVFGELIVDLGTGVSGQLRARGDVQLLGAMDLLLNITGGPAIGVPITIINNTGPNPIAGTFENLPEGATLTTNNMTFAVSYVGGDGNDVSLTRAPIGTGVTRSWDAGGANTLWSNPTNWAGDVLPLAGDSLLFPANLSSPLLTNDLPAGIVFDQLIFRNGSGGPSTVLRGNALGLINGVLGTNTGGSPAVNVPLQLTGPQSFNLASAGYTFGVPITLNGDLTFGGTGNASITITGAIAGAGGIIKTNPGILALNASNSFNGTVQILNGSLTVGHSSALGLPGGGTFIGASVITVLGHTGTLAENFLSVTGSVSVVGTNAVQGQIALPNNGTGFSGGAGSRLTLAGTLTGAGGPTFQGSGSFVLTGTNYCLGQTFVQSSTLLLHGRSGAGDLSVSAAGLLGGTGVMGRITVQDGTISPGASPGVLTSSNFSAFSISTLLFELNGFVAGTDYDQLKVSGTVSLGDATLAVSLGFTPPMGTVFTLINNDGADPISGTFFGLSEGATLTTNGVTLTVSYVGGDGNDVTLTRVFVASGVTRTWDGGGANAAWSNRTNWVGDLAPVEGDSLYFPIVAARKSNTNDFPVFFAFNLLTIGDGNYVLGGAAVTLNGGLTVTNGSPLLSLPVQLNASQTNFVAAGSSFTCNGGFILGPHTLTLSTEGSQSIAGPISGSGGLIKIGAGALSLSGSNSYSGLSDLRTGVISTTTSNGLGSAASGTVVARGTILQFNSGFALAEPFVLDGIFGQTATLQFLGGTSTLTGPISVPAEIFSSQFVLVAGEVRVNGVISGGGVTKSGPGRLVLNANNTHTNVTEIGHGPLIVNGLQPLSEVQLDNFADVFLGGTGTVGRVTALGGNISPGDGPGVLTIASTFTSTATSTNLFELNGPLPGSGHDQLVVLGDVFLNDSALKLVFGFTPAFGQSFTLIDNQGLNPIGGTFAGLPEGALITNGPIVARLTYMGGTGNDVVLRRIAVPTGVARTWDGGGADSLWSNPVNWAGDILPQQGDDIIFPGTVAKAPFFDAGTNMAFNTLLLGRNYNINASAGHTLRAISGMTATNLSGVVNLFMPVTLENSQTWTVTRPGAVLQARRLDLSFATLTHAGAGDLDLRGDITGSGGLVGNSSGGLVVDGTNTFDGTVVVNSGHLTVLSSLALGSTFAGTFVGTAGRISMNLPDGGAIDEPITLAGRVDVVLGVTNVWNGPVILAGTQTAFDTLNAGGLVVNGPLFGGGWQTLGIGSLVLNSPASYTGPFRVGGGARVFVNEDHSAVFFTLTNSGKLGGSGVVGQISATTCASCEINPGPNNAPGALRSASVTLASGTTLRTDLNGPVAGSDYDQLDVTGAVTLTGASLVVTARFNPGAGLSFTLINNDGADPITGTFNNLPQGALLTNGPVVFEISYTGGDGNDLVLTRLIAAPPSTIQPLVLSNGVPLVVGLGQPNVSYVLEATTTLNAPIPWQPILTNITDGTGVYQFLDFDGTNFPMRFYRVLSP